MAKKIKVTQTRSVIGRPKNQKLTIEALGLGRINKTVTKDSTPQIEGMLRKVAHLVNITEG